MVEFQSKYIVYGWRCTEIIMGIEEEHTYHKLMMAMTTFLGHVHWGGGNNMRHQLLCLAVNPFPVTSVG